MTPGCYTGARASSGRVWHVERHVRRLARDARLLGLGEINRARVLALFAELAAPTRAGADRKLRVEIEPGDAGSARLRGYATELEADGSAWRAITAPAAHPGPSPISLAKTTARAYYDAAFAAARAAGADEALCFDGAGFLVEGARTNLVVALADGRLVTPPLARGAQAGIAREIALESVAELREEDVARDDVGAAREVVAINAVRGARAIVALDGIALGGSCSGPWSERLGRLLESG